MGIELRLAKLRAKARVDCAQIMHEVAKRRPDICSTFVGDFIDASRDTDEKGGSKRIAKIGYSGMMLMTATQGAEIFAERFGIDVARDQRLTDIDVGKWEGHALDEIADNDHFSDYLSCEAEAFPDGEAFESVHKRFVASVEQALIDNEPGSNIVIVTHAAPLRIALAHYLSIPLGHFHRLRVSHGAFSVLRFAADTRRPRVLATNWGAGLADLVAVTPR